MRRINGVNQVLVKDSQDEAIRWFLATLVPFIKSQTATDNEFPHSEQDSAVASPFTCCCNRLIYSRRSLTTCSAASANGAPNCEAIILMESLLALMASYRNARFISATLYICCPNSSLISFRKLQDSTGSTGIPNPDWHSAILPAHSPISFSCSCRYRICWMSRVCARDVLLIILVWRSDIMPRIKATATARPVTTAFTISPVSTANYYSTLSS